MERDKITYDIEDGSQHLIDQKGNTIIRLSKISWNKGPYKLDIRKWMFKGENLIPQKGFSFMTDEGPHTLAETLVGIGYGDTEKLQKSLDARPAKPKESKASNVKTYDANKLFEVIKK